MKKFNKIISVFTKTITELENLEKEGLATAEKLIDKAVTIEAKVMAKTEMLRDKANDAKQEAAAALVTAKKLKSLLE